MDVTNNVNLQVENVVTALEYPELAIMHMRAGKAVMLWGDSGIGKTELHEQIAADNSLHFVDFRINIRETVDVRGLPVPDLQKRVTEWLIPLELRCEKPTLLFFDELTNGSLAMQAVTMQIVQERQIGEHRLPDHVWIACAGNRQKDSRAASQMPKPLKNRMAHYTLVVDNPSWVEHAKRTNLPAELIAFIRFRPDYLLRQPTADQNAYASPRSVYECGPYITAAPRLRLKAFRAMVGNDVGTELESFVSMYQALTDIETVLTNPTKAKVPTERSELAAVATAAGRLADRKSFANVITYAKRLPKEYEVMAITDAVDRESKLAETKVYGDWAVENPHITLQQ